MKKIFKNMLVGLVVGHFVIAAHAGGGSGSNDSSISQERSELKQEGAGAYVEDSVITTKVKAALLAEPDLKSLDIKVETFKGVVQLTGSVDSRAKLNKAVEVARNVKGVNSVRSDLRIR